MARAAQDDLARRRRLNDGCCPTHGVPLTQFGVWVADDGLAWPRAGCPRRDCTFRVDVAPGTKLFGALVREGEAG